jgi:hypothetical protein
MPPDGLMNDLVIEAALARQTGVVPIRHRLLTPADIADEPTRPYVIKGLIARGDHAVIMGQPGSGKSVLAPHLAYAVAQGRQVLGRRVKSGTVLYISAEDPHGMKGRVRALMRRHGDAPSFYLFPAAPDLTNPDDLAEIVQHVETIRPVLIVLDTLARAFPGLRENEAEDMGRVVKVARDLADICGSAVVTVHHVAKDAGTTPRGHGCLNGDLDITVLIEGTGREVRAVRLGKNRNGPSDATFAFEIDVEELGTDEDGDPITAPVAGEVDAQAVRPSREDKLPDKPAMLLRTLRNIDPKQIEPVMPEPEMPIVSAVGRDALRTALIAGGWFPEGELRTASDGASGLVGSGYTHENHGNRGITPG